jgi:hypothetical protein
MNHEIRWNQEIPDPKKVNSACAFAGKLISLLLALCDKERHGRVAKRLAASRRAVDTHTLVWWKEVFSGPATCIQVWMVWAKHDNRALPISSMQWQ